MLKWLTRPAWPLVAGKLNLSVVSAAFVIFGLSLIFQSHRWGATPAYHVLLQIFRAPVWGILFLLSGAAMGAAVREFARRWALIAALTFAFCLTTGWMLAFIVRYLTSPSTTPETWVSWAIFDFLLLTVAASIDRPATSVPSDTAEHDITTYRQSVSDALAAAEEDQKALVLRSLVAASEKCRAAIEAACANYGRAVQAASVPDGAALLAIREARNALTRAEEAYTRATGQPVPGNGEG